MDILKIKNAAVNETIEFFKSYESRFLKHGYKILSEIELLNYLNHNHGNYENVINKHDKFNIIDSKDLEIEIKLKLKEYQIAKDSFNGNAIDNNLNIFQDYVVYGMVKDYCTLCFWFEYYFEYLIKMRNENTKGVAKKQVTKYPEKFYSFYHLMLVLDLRTVSNFESDKNDDFNRQEIESYGKEHYGTGQQFYRDYKKIFEIWHNKSEIAKHLGREYKTKIIMISGNDHRIIDKLKDYPN